MNIRLKVSVLLQPQIRQVYQYNAFDNKKKKSSLHTRGLNFLECEVLHLGTYIFTQRDSKTLNNAK
jgi:hypothetical protein